MVILKINARSPLNNHIHIKLKTCIVTSISEYILIYQTENVFDKIFQI